MAGLSDPLEAQLTHADDRVRLSHWLPPQWGVAPRIRIGRRVCALAGAWPRPRSGQRGALFAYRARSVARVSRITVTRICPG